MALAMSMKMNETVVELALDATGEDEVRPKFKLRVS